MPLSQPGAEPVETLPAAGPAGDAQTAQSVEPAASGVATAGVLVAGCALLVLRPNLLRATSSPVLLLVAVFSFVGMVGAWWPLPSAGRGSGGVSAGMAVAVGVGGFALGRTIGGGHSPGPLTLHVVILNSLAAVAEEAFFRRLTYAVLNSGGAAWATAGSALLFALVHLATYGSWVLPIDVAAGLILGWQRWATGSWRVPAVTHVLANLLVVI